MSSSRKELTPHQQQAMVEKLKSETKLEVESKQVIPIDHGDLLCCMMQLGYKISEGGMCYGFACMAMQAILANDLSTYNRRMKLIQEIIEKDSKGSIHPEKLSSKIDKARKEVREKKQLTPEEEAIQQDILSIPALFEGVALYFNPLNYPYLFEEKMRPTNQNPELTFSRVLPHDLTSKEEIKEQGKPSYKVEKNNVEKAMSFSGIYNLEELEKYFTALRNTMGREHKLSTCCFILTSSNHSVTIGYDPAKTAWQWIDTSSSIDITRDKDIANQVMNAFSENNITNIAAFSTEIFITNSQNKETKNSQHEQTTDYPNRLRNNSDWQDLHSITIEKTKRIDSTEASWLHIAAKNHPQEVEPLLAAGADPNNITNRGVTPLFFAAQNGHDKAVELLLADKRTNPNLITNQDGAAPLLIAAQNGHDKVVALLLADKRIIDPNLAIKSGETPLTFAALNNHCEIVKLLLADERTLPSLARKDGMSPLFFAVQNGHHEAVTLLLADVRKRTSPNLARKDSATPLHCAAYLGYIKVAAALLADERTDPNLASNDGTTALHLAVQNGDVKLVELLLEDERTDPNLASNDGTTALHLAKAMKHTEIIKMLDNYHSEKLLPTALNRLSMLTKEFHPKNSVESVSNNKQIENPSNKK